MLTGITKYFNPDPTLSQPACIQRLQIHQNLPFRILFFFFRILVHIDPFPRS